MHPQSQIMINVAHAILPTQPSAACGLLPSFTSLFFLLQLANDFLQSQQAVARAQPIRGKVAQRIQTTLISTPIKGPEELLKDVGWDLSTVPKPLPALPEPLASSSSEEQPDPKGYQQQSTLKVPARSISQITTRQTLLFPPLPLSCTQKWAPHCIHDQIPPE